MPLVFRAEGHALALIKTHNLFPIGAQVEHVEKSWPGGAASWRIVIYTAQPEAVLKYLASRMPGVSWTQSAAP